MNMDSFAFVIHPIDPKKDVSRKFPLLGKMLSPGLIHFFSTFFPPVYLAEIEGISSRASGKPPDGGADAQAAERGGLQKNRPNRSPGGEAGRQDTGIRCIYLGGWGRGADCRTSPGGPRDQWRCTHCICSGPIPLQGSPRPRNSTLESRRGSRRRHRGDRPGSSRSPG